MAGRNAHAMIGAGVGVGVLVIYKLVKDQKPSFGEFIAAAIGGAAFGLLPDLLEPATDPNHRQFFHSYAAAGLISWANLKVWQNPILLEKDKLHFTLASAGYLSHLLADSGTPKGVPII